MTEKRRSIRVDNQWVKVEGSVYRQVATINRERSLRNMGDAYKVWQQEQHALSKPEAEPKKDEMVVAFERFCRNKGMNPIQGRAESIRLWKYMADSTLPFETQASMLINLGKITEKMSLEEAERAVLTLDDQKNGCPHFLIGQDGIYYCSKGRTGANSNRIPDLKRCYGHYLKTIQPQMIERTAKGILDEAKQITVKLGLSSTEAFLKDYEAKDLQIKAKEVEVENARKEVKSLAQRNKQLERRDSELYEKINSLKTELERLREIEKRAQSLEAESRQKDAENEEIDALKNAALSEMEGQIEALAKERDNAAEPAGRAQAELETLTRELTEKEAIIYEKETAISQATAKIEALTKENTELKTDERVLTLDRELSEAQSELSKLKGELESKGSQIQSLEERVSTLQPLQDEVSKLRSQLEETKRLQSEVERLRSQLTHSQRTAEILETQLEQEKSRTDVEGLRRLIADMKQQAARAAKAKPFFQDCLKRVKCKKTATAIDEVQCDACSESPWCANHDFYIHLKDAIEYLPDSRY